MKPIELLEKELNLLMRSRDKSIESYNQNSITEKLHEIHLNNLNELIEKYKEAINKLK